MFTDRLVKDVLQYLDDEKIVRNHPTIKYILETIPNSKIQYYRRK